MRGEARGQLVKDWRRKYHYPNSATFSINRCGQEAAARLAARLLAEHPGGFTVSMFREAAGNTRKHALPLLARLDGTGITRRRDDLRIGGPRLPEPG